MNNATKKNIYVISITLSLLIPGILLSGAYFIPMGEYVESVPLTKQKLLGIIMIMSSAVILLIHVCYILRNEMRALYDNNPQK